MFGKHKKRPSSADGERPTSSKIVRPCSVESSRPASADESGSARSSRRSTPRKRPRKPRAFSTNSSPKGMSRDGSPKSSSRPHSPAGSSKSRPSSSSTFRRWGSPYSPNSKNSTRPCSPDYTVVSLQDKEGGFPEQKRPRGQPSPELALSKPPVTISCILILCERIMLVHLVLQFHEAHDRFLKSSCHCIRLQIQMTVSKLT
jgi:hypothetical protein